MAAADKRIVGESQFRPVSSLSERPGLGCWWSRTMDPSICRYARVVPETITSMFTSTGGCELASRVVHFGCEWKDNPVPAVRLLIYQGTRRAPSTPPPLISRRRPGALVSCDGGGGGGGHGGDGHPPARTWGFPRRFPSMPSSRFPCSVPPSTAAGNLMAAARDHGGGPEALRTCIAARAYRHYYYYGLLGRENSPTFNPPSEIARNFYKSLFYFFHQRLARRRFNTDDIESNSKRKCRASNILPISNNNFFFVVFAQVRRVLYGFRTRLPNASFLYSVWNARTIDCWFFK